MPMTAHFQRDFLSSATRRNQPLFVQGRSDEPPRQPCNADALQHMGIQSLGKISGKHAIKLITGHPA